MKKLSEIRQAMAEKGWECTPAEIKSMVEEILKLRRKFRKSGFNFDLSPDERQELRNAMAERGEEITLAELDEVIDIGSKIKDLRL